MVTGVGMSQNGANEMAKQEAMTMKKSWIIFIKMWNLEQIS